MVKIIALLPVKNEEWVLPSYLSSVKKIADHIIALDDNSVDNSVKILESNGVEVISSNTGADELVNMSKRRQYLLDMGRKAGGTHFICLDADETFSENFINQARDIIKTLEPGQKITMRWVHPFKSIKNYLTDERSPFGSIWKDFIFCDASEISFANNFLSESRTPGEWINPMRLDEGTGVVIHWQFTDWEANQWKQAWYRCTELIEGGRSARRINHTYSITKSQTDQKISKIPKHWIGGLIKPTFPSNKILHYEEQINKYFDQYGIKYFEYLDIWDIETLQKKFIFETGRLPRPKKYHAFLIVTHKLITKYFGKFIK